MDVDRVGVLTDTSSSSPALVEEPGGWFSGIWQTLASLGTYFAQIPQGAMRQLDGIAWRSNPKQQLEKYSTAIKCIIACLPEGLDLELQAIAEQLTSTTLGDDRQRYQEFYKELGTFLQTQPDHEAAQDLAEMIISKVTLSHYLNTHLPTVIGGDLPEDLIAQIKAVADAPRERKGPLIPLMWQSLKAATGYEFHAAGMGNLPNMQCIIDHEEGSTECIHMGVPVKEKWWSNSIDPVFRGFLAARKRQGRPYLYICLLDITNNEAAWWDELAALRKDYPLQLVALAQDSAFAKDKTPIAPLKFSELLKAEMLAGREKGYHFPEEWRQELSFWTELNGIVDQVRWTFFKDVEELDQHGRAAFKQMVDALIVDYLVRNKNYPTFTVACRDSADRTGRLKCVWAFLLDCVSQGAATAMANSSIIAKKRELKSCRFGDLESAMAFMKEHETECRDMMAIRPGLKITDVRLPKLPYELKV